MYNIFDATSNEFEKFRFELKIITFHEYFKADILKEIILNTFRIFSEQSYDSHFKHVHKYLNQLGYDNKIFEGVTVNNLKHFFNFHSKQIEHLIEVNEMIDSLLVIYSGHGAEDTIITSDGREYFISKIHGSFDNISLDVLRGKPKFYLYDCCRGDYQDIGKNIGIISINISNI